MNYCIDRIVLNYCLAFSLNHHMPVEIYKVINRAINLENKTKRPIMKIQVSYKEYKVFKDYSRTTPNFLNIN